MYSYCIHTLIYCVCLYTAGNHNFSTFYKREQLDTIVQYAAMFI